MKLIHLFEKRRNPELNPKVSLEDFLEPHKNKKDVYVHFTDIQKVGINPKTGFVTPAGVYTYPLDIAWKKYDKLYNVPFAGQKRYVYLLKHTKPVFELEDYSTSDWKKDKNKLISKYKGKRFSVNEDTEDWNDFTIYASRNMLDPEDWNPDNLTIEQLIEVARVIRKPKKLFSSRMWNATRLIAMNGKSEPNPVVWNKILREMGYGAVSDRGGAGVIHPHEKIQTLFLTPKAFKTIDLLDRQRSTR